MHDAGREWLRAVAARVHGRIARTPWLAKRYLMAVGAVGKRMPDALTKRRLVNLMRAAPWPEVALPAQIVRVASDLPVRIIPHVGEFDFDALFFQTLAYEAEVFEALRPRMATYDAVLEIGANVGVYTLFFAKLLTGEGRRRPVFAFEPSPAAFARLEANLKLNDAVNAHAFNCAVSTTTGPVEFFEPRGHLTNGSLHRAFAELFSDQVDSRIVGAVDGRFIEELVRPFGRVLIKIDVEGAEVTVLRSLEPLILAKRPDIALEVLPQDVDELRALEFIDRLYRRFSITDRGLVPTSRFEADARFRDYLLVPLLAVGRDGEVRRASGTTPAVSYARTSSGGSGAPAVTGKG